MSYGRQPKGSCPVITVKKASLSPTNADAKRHTQPVTKIEEAIFCRTDILAREFFPGKRGPGRREGGKLQEVGLAHGVPHLTISR